MATKLDLTYFAKSATFLTEICSLVVICRRLVLRQSSMQCLNRLKLDIQLPSPFYLGWLLASSRITQSAAGLSLSHMR